MVNSAYDVRVYDFLAILCTQACFSSKKVRKNCMYNKCLKNMYLHAFLNANYFRFKEIKILTVEKSRAIRSITPSVSSLESI